VVEDDQVADIGHEDAGEAAVGDVCHWAVRDSAVRGS
jgi:hypothetical protein